MFEVISLLCLQVCEVSIILIVRLYLVCLRRDYCKPMIVNIMYVDVLGTFLCQNLYTVGI